MRAICCALLLIGCAKSTPSDDGTAGALTGPGSGSGAIAGSLVFPGVYDPDQLPVDAGETVLALCDDALEAVEVTVVPAEAGAVSLDVSCSATALFIDMEGLLTPGKVKQAKVKGSMGGEDGALLTVGQLRARLRTETNDAGGYAVVIDIPEQTWTLVEHTTATTATPALVWAGDLDHDGLMDVILDAPDEPGAHFVHLLLSGPATQGPLAVVATLRAPGG